MWAAPQRVKKPGIDQEGARTTGELEGAQPSSNWIKCPATPFRQKRGFYEDAKVFHKNL